MEESKNQTVNISRYVQRLLPVSVSCPAYIDRIEKAMKDGLVKYFEHDKAEDCNYFNVVYKGTYNNSVKAQEVEDVAICHMAELKPNIKLSRTARDHLFTIHVHTLKTVCCISFVKDFYHFAKYNLAEFQAKLTLANIS